MTDPTTVNILLAVPTRGSDPGTWDTPVNNNSTSIDGYFGGVTTISLSNSNVVLTAPAGVTTPGAGPTQSQNRVIVLTGTLTTSLGVTLPLPGQYTIQNLTTGNFYIALRTPNAGNQVCTPQGSVMEFWNDGTNVWYVKNQIPGAMTFMGGVIAIPSWIANSTINPYLLCDGSIYNFSIYPALGNLYGSSFGGNGVTTFGVPDLRGRVPLAYDGTGTRITVAGSGINGQTMGAAGGAQNEVLATTNLPPYTPAGVNGGSQSINPWTGAQNVFGGGPGSGPLTNATPVVISGSNFTFTGTPQGGVSTPVPIVQPSIVSGIWLVAT